MAERNNHITNTWRNKEKLALKVKRQLFLNDTLVLKEKQFEQNRGLEGFI